ncbi:MAG TPA: divergent polysaccharide deacetylase family protein [Candidatus Baltobacteraceae bacterium]|nr:divergent polysaccharide deacetylase family protein [Candidatus Baltobacteraceae bacterium]
MLLLVVAGIAAGIWLLGPRHQHHPRRVAALTPRPSPTPAATLATPLPTSAPTASPSPTAAATTSAAPAAPATMNPNGPQLALIVDDCGQWIDTERGFIALDIPLTISVLPDVHYTATIANEAAAAGKGVMLHLPMETVSGLNPGPGKVTTEMTDAQIVSQTQEDLAQVPLAGGVNNHEGSKASADARVMRDVIGVLAKRGNLFFVDSKTSAASVGEAVARARGVPTAARNVFLDNQANEAYTMGQLREAAAIARRDGSAIAIGHPRPTTLAAVKAMIPELEASGIRFVLVRDLVSTDP